MVEFGDYFNKRTGNNRGDNIKRVFCNGPFKYVAQQGLQQEIGDFKAGLQGQQYEEAFLPAIAPGTIEHWMKNDYYPNDEAYLFAIADAMHEEYKAIVDAGLTLQVDDPFLCDMLIDPDLDAKTKRKTAWMYVEVINESLKGIAPEKVRFHTCYSINEGPRIHDAPMSQVAPYMLKINAGAYSFEYGNPRHEHEYRVWEEIKFPDGKKLIPGMVMHAVNIVEHPELIAERLVRFANAVGAGNVMAGADCGFSSQATYKPEVHPTVMWAKFEAMRKGADLAARQLSRKPAPRRKKK
jgi:5-methyltetrahydropteroyltriglutamate--homocysteine methyltransferase